MKLQPAKSTFRNNQDVKKSVLRILFWIGHQFEFLTQSKRSISITNFHDMSQY